AVTSGSGRFTGFAGENSTDGLITVSATVTDGAGNTATPSNTSFTLDTTADVAPLLSLSAANPAGGASLSTFSITLSGIDSDVVSDRKNGVEGNNAETRTLPPPANILV